MIHRAGHRWPSAVSKGAGLCLALLLAACTLENPDTTPRTSPQPAPRADVPAPSAESQELATFYARFEQRQLTSGLLRRDGGGPDTPYNARLLAENFERIALYDEYTLRAGRFVPQQAESRLRRWTGPVRVTPVFGRSVNEARKAEDVRLLQEYVQRLARITGADITNVSSTGAANYHVLFLNNDELKAAEPLLRQLVPGIDSSTLLDITSMDRLTFCSVYAFSSQARPDSYIAAVAIIRAEHPPLIRQSCIHEEVAQGLGLANDSPSARPSIFNDDDEFALLTSHDEQLLRILYDPRLSIGLTPAESRPRVAQIANELMGGPS